MHWPFFSSILRLQNKQFPSLATDWTDNTSIIIYFHAIPLFLSIITEIAYQQLWLTPSVAVSYNWCTVARKSIFSYVTLLNSQKYCAMAQVVSRRPLTAEAPVRARVSPRGIYGGQSDIGQAFLRVLRFYLSVYHFTVAFQTHIIWEMRNMLA
jgi:hypothetical protein